MNMGVVDRQLGSLLGGATGLPGTSAATKAATATSTLPSLRIASSVRGWWDSTGRTARVR